MDITHDNYSSTSNKGTASSGEHTQLLHTNCLDDVLQDALVNEIVPQPALLPPVHKHGRAALENNGDEMQTMQSQINALQSEVRTQLKVVREEMADTRKQLLSALSALSESHAASQTRLGSDTDGALPASTVNDTDGASSGLTVVNTWGRRETAGDTLGLGTAAMIVAQTNSAARERRRRPSFD